jgi:HK97 family phage major capsid protein
VIERAEAAEGDEESRTVELSFASDAPITHFSWSQWRWIDIQLSMDKKNVRTNRLESGAPLLADHNHRDVIGVIESFTLSTKEGKARAKVRFSKSTRGEEIYRDVVDGIRKNVSVGFMIHKLVLKEERDKKKGEIDLYEATDWEPYECSIVAVPADISVGVGRSQEQFSQADEPVRDLTPPSTSERKMPEENNQQPAAPAVEAPAQRTAVEVARDEVESWGRTLGGRDQETATAYLRECVINSTTPSMDGFRAALRGAAPPATTAPAENPADVAARNGGQPARVSSRVTLRNFQGEGAQESAYRSGQFLRAVLGRSDSALKYCREHGIMLERVQSEASNEAGGFLVPDEFENVMIDLRNEYGVFRRVARNTPMSRESKSRPRRTSGLTAYPMGATGSARAITESTKGWDLVHLNARQWGVLVKYENELSEDAVISIADDLAGECAYAFTISEDDCGFNGDGSANYHGIVGVRPRLRAVDATIANIKGLQVATGNVYSEIILKDFSQTKARLPQYAYKRSTPKWYVSTSFFYNVMEPLKLGTGGNSAENVEKGGDALRFLGFPVELVESMPVAEANSQICALFGSLELASMFGDRRGCTIAMTDSHEDDFAEAVMTIRATERFDINVHDVGDTSVAGPIVGLITAAG